VDNSLIRCSIGNVGLFEFRGKAPGTLRDGFTVRVDDYNQSRLRLCRPLPVLGNGAGVVMADPLFPGTGAAWQFLETNVVGALASTIQVVPDEGMVARVLRQDNDLRRLAHSIQPRAINSDGGSSLSPLRPEKAFNRVGPPRSLKN